MIIDFPLITTFISHSWFRFSANSFLPENVSFKEFYFWKKNSKISDFVSELGNASLFYFHRKNRPDLPILNWNHCNVSKAVKVKINFFLKIILKI